MMEHFVNIVIDEKPLNIFTKSFILDIFDWGSEYASGISKVIGTLMQIWKSPNMFLSFMKIMYRRL